MRPSTYVHALFMAAVDKIKSTVRIEVIIIQTNSLYFANLRTQLSHVVYTGWNCSFLTSTTIMGVQIGEMSRLD
jgi:hypothetical protein